MRAKTLLLKLISPIPPPRDAYYNAHKEYELGSMEVLKEVPFGRVVMGLLVFLKVGIILVLWCLQWGLNFPSLSPTSPNFFHFQLSLIQKTLIFLFLSIFQPTLHLTFHFIFALYFLLDFSHFFHQDRLATQLGPDVHFNSVGALFFHLSILLSIHYFFQLFFLSQQRCTTHLVYNTISLPFTKENLNSPNILPNLSLKSNPIRVKSYRLGIIFLRSFKQRSKAKTGLQTIGLSSRQDMEHFVTK